MAHSKAVQVPPSGEKEKSRMSWGLMWWAGWGDINLEQGLGWE